MKESTMKKIPLTKGQVALVDDEDYEQLIAHKWYYGRGKDRHTGYAHRKQYANGKSMVLLMHRVILGPIPDGMEVDHIDHDGINNTRQNLRICTHTQNQQNHTVRRQVKSSQYKGVSFSTNVGRWRAGIRNNTHWLGLGYYDTEYLAACAYDAAARELFGAFACTNFSM
jgi:hypothetical protein